MYQRKPPRGMESRQDPSPSLLSYNNTADSELEEIENPIKASFESLHSSTFDDAFDAGSECSWSAISSESGSCHIVPIRQPFYLDSSNSVSVYDACEAFTQASQAGSSAYEWSLVGDHATQARQQDAQGALCGEQREYMTNNSQLSDFETHPGHRYWIWDTQRERWRRRGRSGLDEMDWFPETFS
ncbi:hypothetical protein F66182_9522 [Fusarium sp. NRRL 66182]|nr:hypothetical protein F66182_9522 [Fusarium sp. NRRL 66182]